MKHELLKFAKGFRVSISNKNAQGAVMVLAPGATEGDAENRHRGADQWTLGIAHRAPGILSIDGPARSFTLASCWVGHAPRFR
jgi:hypothetical protein